MRRIIHQFESSGKIEQQNSAGVSGQRKSNSDSTRRPCRRSTRTPSADSSYDRTLDYKPPANERNPNTDDRQQKGDELLSAQKIEFRRRKIERWGYLVGVRKREKGWRVKRISGIRRSRLGSVAADARAARVPSPPKREQRGDREESAGRKDVVVPF